MLSADVKRFRSDFCKLRKTSNSLFAKVVRVRKLADLLANYAKTAESYGTEAQRILAESPSPSISFWCLSRPEEAKQLRLLTEEVMRSRKEYGTLASLKEVEELVQEEKSAFSQALMALRDFITLQNEMFAVPEEDRLDINGAKIAEDALPASVALDESPRKGSGEGDCPGSSVESVQPDRKRQLDEVTFQVEDLFDLVQLRQAELESQCDASACECQGWIERFLYFTSELQGVVATLLEVELNDAKQKASALEDEDGTCSASSDVSDEVEVLGVSPQEQECVPDVQAAEPDHQQKRICCRNFILYLDSKVQQCSGMDMLDRDNKPSPTACGPVSDRSSILSVPFPHDSPTSYDSVSDPLSSDESPDEYDSNPSQKPPHCTAPSPARRPSQPRESAGLAIVRVADPDHHVFSPERLADDSNPLDSFRAPMTIQSNPPAKQCPEHAPALLVPKVSAPPLVRFFMPKALGCWSFLR